MRKEEGPEQLVEEENGLGRLEAADDGHPVEEGEERESDERREEGHGRAVVVQQRRHVGPDDGDARQPTRHDRVHCL
eukprot:CAMPEP_0180200344 /NCGR_PEP_ID=MMETSP0987-20121128/6184_1 /TAXON_ID=697907 /ORGANISM="non described non described, Strain CCMP2293" /LENGTH=76 /DNA_ID=CAMNT_0022155473 /DNA_START=146 /DNA_END=377 /DNA_ORIENTATION=-